MLESRSRRKTVIVGRKVGSRRRVDVKSGSIIDVEVAQQALSPPPCFHKVEEEEMQTVIAGCIQRRAFIFKQGKADAEHSAQCQKVHIYLVTLSSIDGKTFKVDEAVAKQFVTIEHFNKDRLTSSDSVVITNVSGDILAKIIEYCKFVVTKLHSGKNDVKLKAFVSGLVNDDEETLFGLLVAADYLDIKGLLSLACKKVLDLIKRKDLVNIYKIFNITPEFSLENEERMRIADSWAFNKLDMQEHQGAVTRAKAKQLKSHKDQIEQEKFQGLNFDVQDFMGLTF
ncbi:hypothetical protein M9H77_26010 [Catharanthus roseus]|uniref:Uncharacterized protein n=1 Tax=Catharanthus roseus TaxID=4058 RepID=A0ACC0A9T7_CATRO|nr:hypothetical protein M9H77_26010 [Catharanthus roseus]